MSSSQEVDMKIIPLLISIPKSISRRGKSLKLPVVIVLIVVEFLRDEQIYELNIPKLKSTFYKINIRLHSKHYYEYMEKKLLKQSINKYL